MSVLIRDMDLPSDCVTCPMHMDAYKGKKRIICGIMDMYSDTWLTRPEWCPMEEYEEKPKTEPAPRVKFRWKEA